MDYLINTNGTTENHLGKANCFIPRSLHQNKLQLYLRLNIFKFLLFPLEGEEEIESELFHPLFSAQMPTITGAGSG